MMCESQGASSFAAGLQGQDLHASPGWQAHLDLAFARIREKTVLTRRRHRGPLAVQKPFYPEGLQRCHAIILHPPGGIVGGDGLTISVESGNDSQAIITTPAAGKVYRSAGEVARQDIHFKLGADSTLEWLPQETIIYDGARMETRLSVDLEHGARFIGWDLMCLGLPASKKPFKNGDVVQRMVIRREGMPLLYETLRISGEGPLLWEKWGLAGYPVAGLMAATAKDPFILDHVRKEIAPGPPSLFAATLFNGLLICRFMGNGAMEGLGCFRRVWEIIRPRLLGCNACTPRIWST